ncbi:MAG: hypothetical protein KatS3mg090_0815 [Patescibacteria group bacterium]|nr:MAG: hypothetical protein KatS3mg090_0815 [Patescibacteria group bacterium]
MINLQSLVIKNQKIFLIANKQIINYLEKYKVKSRLLYYDKKDFNYKLKYLKGQHNKTNSAGVYKLLVDVLGNDSQEVVDYLVNFKPVAFRLEQVAKIKNLIFINDSTSTTPIALTKAIQSFKSGNIILIMGGNTKGLPYDDVVKEIANVDKVYFLKGSFSDEVKPEIGRLYPDKISAVKQELEPILNDIKKRFLGKDRQYYVLFSPGATSFAQFNNEFDRGRAFNQLINQIF